MSKLTDQLTAELRAIFGESFGAEVTAPLLEEAVEQMLEAGFGKANKATKMAAKSDARQPVGNVKKKEKSTKTKQHNPFKRSPNLGKGPGTPPGYQGRGPRHHDQEKCWNCTCGNIYTKGCECVGTGADKSCRKGRRKPIKIKKDYRKAYNKEYHKWRGQKSASKK